VNVLLVMVLNLGVCIRFLTKDLVATNVLICGLNFSAVVGFLKSFVYLRLLTGVRIVGQIDLLWLVQ
jgi:hypothetical protein